MGAAEYNMKENDYLSEKQANTLLSDFPKYGSGLPESDIGKNQHVCSCGGLKEKITAIEKETEAIKATIRVMIEALVELSEIDKFKGNYYA